MLAHWFERGLGQIVAPDEQAAARQEEEGGGGASSLWQLVAPDPVYEASRHGQDTSSKTPSAPPAHAFLSPPPSTKVRCQHCHEWTPVKNEKAFSTPSNEGGELSELDGLVLQAAKETAASMTSPKAVTELRYKVFSLCANSKPLKEKARNRLKKLVEKEPSLLQCRSSNLGIVPDGYTPLIAAASVNNVIALQILLDTPHAQLLLQDRDLQGRTALHVAAQEGQVEAVECLHQHYGEDAPVDLTGHTPLGRAVTSANPSAVKNQQALEEKLFSPGDVSVCGHKTPAKDRTRDVSSLHIKCGFADMPGFRVAMEDAVCMEFWSDDSAKALFGVCDGHGDAGLTSQFVAEETARILKTTEEYPQHDFSSAFKTACLRVDEELKQSKANCGGGTTAVLALVTTGAIVVANVGDSRCILIQSREDSSSSLGVSALEETMADLALADETKTTAEASAKPDATEKDGTTEPPESEPEVSKEKITLAEPNHGNIVVTALSEDHKPILDVEKTRIEKAGLSVVAETFEENNEEVTIWKVMLSETERMAVSRSFGDYEYKSNPKLSAQEQAVVALPDVRVHTRNADRDMYLVLACDGVWDVMSNEEVANFVVATMENLSQQGLSAEQILPQAGDLLLNECLKRKSRDNMTVVVVALDKAAKQISGGHVVGRALNFSQEE